MNHLFHAAAGIAMLAITATTAGAGPAYRVVDRVSGPDGRWDYASVDTANNRVLIAHGSQVTAMDIKTKSVTGVFATAQGAHAAIAINGGAQVLITNGASDTATIVDGHTGSLVATIPTGKNPDAATVDSKTGLVLVADHGGGDLTLIDPASMKAVGRIPVGGALEEIVTDGAGRAFVNVEDRNEIVAIDLAARKAGAHYKLAGCEGPTGLAYVPADKLLIATCDGVAAVVSAASGKPVASIKIGDGADGVAFDAGRKLAFVPAGESGSLSVISIAGGKATLVETIKTQTSARTIALDPRDGRVYLPAARTLPAAAGQRPAQAPGSFALLVVDK